MRTRQIRGPGEQKQRPRAQAAPLAEDIHSAEKHAAAAISRIVSKPKRLLLIGAVKYGPKSKKAADLARFLCSEGGLDMMDVSNIYRMLREFVRDGIVSKNEEGEHMLTEIGERIGLSERQFKNLVSASKAIRATLESVQSKSE